MQGWGFKFQISGFKLEGFFWGGVWASSRLAWRGGVYLEGRLDEGLAVSAGLALAVTGDTPVPPEVGFFSATLPPISTAV
jgi:hypothetical protein